MVVFVFFFQTDRTPTARFVFVLRLPVSRSDTPPGNPNGARLRPFSSFSRAIFELVPRDMDKHNKRPLEEEEEDDDDDEDNDGLQPGNDRKKFKATREPATTADTKETVGLSNLCDDVVMHIFKYLPHDSLANMSR